MTQLEAQNPFAAPRALVDDPGSPGAGGVVDATRGQRLLAVLLDMVPAIVLNVVVWIYVGVTIGFSIASQPDVGQLVGSLLGSLLGLFGLLMLLGLGWAIYNLVILHRYGQVWGKRMMGIRVVRSDGTRASLPRILFMRWGLLYVVMIAATIVFSFVKMPFLGYLVGPVDTLMIFGAARLCLHDRLGGTRVVTAASSEHATLEGSRRPGAYA